MKLTSSRRSGFTLPEAMVGSFAFGLLSLGILTLFRTVMIEAYAGSSQARFLSMARRAEMTISRCVQNGISASAVSNTIQIGNIDGVTVSSLSYEDLDNDPATVSNNVIRYKPNIYVGGGEVTVCNYVRPMDDGSSVFTNLLISPNTIRICFHIGDGTNAVEATTVGSGRGYQGTEVRFSVGARNLYRWYQ